MAQLGCEAVRLVVPMRVDLKFGRNWGDAKHTWAKLHGLPEPAPDVGTSGNICAVCDQRRTCVAASGETTPSSNTRSPGGEFRSPTLIDQPLHDGKILCPFHDDHHPSCHIYADHFYCFVCEAHGDQIDWLREVEGLNFQEALDALADWEPRDAVGEA